MWKPPIDASWRVAPSRGTASSSVGLRSFRPAGRQLDGASCTSFSGDLGDSRPSTVRDLCRKTFGLSADGQCLRG
jgi:hypothetical protein